MISHKFILPLFLVFVVKNVTADKNVPCEKVQYVNYLNAAEKFSCMIDQATIIDSNDISIYTTLGNTLTGINLNGNQKISFLPIMLHKTFSNLIIIDARNCAIKTLSRENFKQLTNLEALYLSSNRLEIIESGVFQDLTAVKRIYLSIF